ncbi:hypothetical protein GS580_16670 [Rhodococcus hoagii]|nr:hypothetical protein [Prescottella equi]
MTDIIDAIDALVDEQMAGGEPIGGYDYDDPDYPRCPHCGDDWHGLKITRRMRDMRWDGAFDEDYRYAEDDSEVLCPGSDFIGPWATPQELNRIRNGRDSPWHRRWELPELPPEFQRLVDAQRIPDLQPEMQFPPDSFSEQLRRQRDLIRRLAEFAAVPRATYQPMQHLLVGDRVVIESDGRRQEVVVVSDPVQHPDGRIEYTTADPRYSAQARALAEVRDRIRRGETPLPNAASAIEGVGESLGGMRECIINARIAGRHTALLEALNTHGRAGEGGPPVAYATGGRIPTPETRQERALPRPSTTPPMWAVQPNRSPRRRNR